MLTLDPTIIEVENDWELIEERETVENVANRIYKITPDRWFACVFDRDVNLAVGGYFGPEKEIRGLFNKWCAE